MASRGPLHRAIAPGGRGNPGYPPHEPRRPHRDLRCHRNGDQLYDDVSATRRRMATSRQKSAARRNIKKAAAAAKRKRTIAHLPKKTRTALGKQGAAMRKKRSAVNRRSVRHELP